MLESKIIKFANKRRINFKQYKYYNVGSDEESSVNVVNVRIYSRFIEDTVVFIKYMFI